MANENNQPERRLAAVARGIMRCYALRWRYARRCPGEEKYAAALVADAVRMRKLSMNK